MQFFPWPSTNGIREIPPSVAAAIAEGNLDPATMEAFDPMPTSGKHLKPTEFQTSGMLQLLETADISRQESCFMVFSSHKTREKNKTGKFFKPTWDLMLKKCVHIVLLYSPFMEQRFLFLWNNLDVSLFWERQYFLNGISIKIYSLVLNLSINWSLSMHSNIYFDISVFFLML